MPKLSPLTKRLMFEYINNQSNTGFGFLNFLLASKNNLQVGRRYIQGVSLGSFGYSIFITSDYFKHWNGDDLDFSNKINMRVESVLAILKLLKPWNQKLYIDFYTTSVKLATEVVSYLQGYIDLEVYRAHGYKNEVDFINSISPRIKNICSPFTFLGPNGNLTSIEGLGKLEVLKLNNHIVDSDVEFLSKLEFRTLDLSNLSSPQRHDCNLREPEYPILEVLILRENVKYNFVSSAFHLRQYMNKEHFPNFKRIKIYLDAPDLKTLQHDKIVDALVIIVRRVPSFKEAFSGLLKQLDVHLNDEVAITDQAMAKDLVDELKQNEVFHNAKFLIAPFASRKGIYIVDKQDQLNIDIKLRWKF